jgi:hypothetical protein
MRNPWVILLLAATAAFLLTILGSAVIFLAPLTFSSKVVYALNPGAMLAELIWPSGAHSGGFLAAFSSLFMIVADFVVWFTVTYFVIITLSRLFARSPRRP